jgi:hypothetical protein
MRNSRWISNWQKKAKYSDKTCPPLPLCPPHWYWRGITQDKASQSPPFTDRRSLVLVSNTQMDERFVPLTLQTSGMRRHTFLGLTLRRCQQPDYIASNDRIIDYCRIQAYFSNNKSEKVYFFKQINVFNYEGGKHKKLYY